MPDTDLIKLYSARILALAANIGLTDRLELPDATAKKRAPLCGSTVTVDIEVEDGKITAFGQDVKACALGQAAASILAQNIVGASFNEVHATRTALHDMLKKDGPVPTGRFEGFEVLLPAREYKNRHASILLSLDATLDAIEKTRAQNCA
ncbi:MULTISPECIES: iron-sulfur cluster assembly scaffold protein [Falsihalocynthiibacter]|uniref:iron-sulfur cluster assembly scaffold protein n=1 Tax=Falsihalocynthiibacter TaxID=2854182 RepID=UPI003002230E